MHYCTLQIVQCLHKTHLLEKIIYLKYFDIKCMQSKATSKLLQLPPSPCNLALNRSTYNEVQELRENDK